MNDRPMLALIDSNRRHLVRAATRLLGPGDAEDAVQDAYVRALEAELPEFSVAQAWLLTVVRNLAIDRLRRRDWMQQWLTGMNVVDRANASPSVETVADLAEEAAGALRLLAACLTPADGASLLLHEVFGVTHAEIAEASGGSEVGSRQQLRRALARLRRASSAPDFRRQSELEPSARTVLRLFVQALQLRNPQALWAVIRQPLISGLQGKPTAAAETASAPRATTCGVLHVGGQLGLVLMLDGVQLCVLQLGVQAERDLEAVSP